MSYAPTSLDINLALNGYGESDRSGPSATPMTSSHRSAPLLPPPSYPTLPSSSSIDHSRNGYEMCPSLLPPSASVGVGCIGLPSNFSFPSNWMPQPHSTSGMNLFPESSDRTAVSVRRGSYALESPPIMRPLNDRRGSHYPLVPVRQSNASNLESMNLHSMTPPSDDLDEPPSSQERKRGGGSGATPTRKPRAPRQEALRHIKHLIHQFRVDPWALDASHGVVVPSSDPALGGGFGGSAKTVKHNPKFITPKMDPPLIATFKAILHTPLHPGHLADDDDDDDAMSDASEELTFPYREATPPGFGEEVSPEGHRWLVHPSQMPQPETEVKQEHEDAYGRRWIPSSDESFILPSIANLADLHHYVPPTDSWTLPPLSTVPCFGFFPDSDHRPDPIMGMGQHHYHNGHPFEFRPLLDSFPPPRSSGAGSSNSSGTVLSTSNPATVFTTSPGSSSEYDVLRSQGLSTALVASIAHPPPRDHVCNICQKRFERPSSLQTHMTVHSGEKPFECDVPGCGKVFNVRSNLRRHLKMHGAQYARNLSASPPLLRTSSSVLATLRRKSGIGRRNSRQQAMESTYDENSQLTTDAGGPWVASAAGAPGDRRGSGGGAGGTGCNNIDTFPQDKLLQHWVPDSLKNVSNVMSLSSKGPFDTTAACRGVVQVCVPLPPVRPWGYTAESELAYEERDSFASDVPEAPYHPTQWSVRPVLPGPGLVNENELTTNANYPRRLMLSVAR